MSRKTAIAFALPLAGLILALALNLLAGQAAWAKKENPMVKLTTSLGEITLELYPDKAPKTVENFLEYVNKGYYNGTIFHRVIDGFMIQGGGLTANLGMKASGQPIQNEADNGLTNDNYTVAMARTGDPHSARAQFFINVANNDFLNHKSKTPEGWGYAVFGKVVKGQDVVDKIKVVGTTTKAGYGDVPITPVVIEKAEVVEE